MAAAGAWVISSVSGINSPVVFRGACFPRLVIFAHSHSASSLEAIAEPMYTPISSRSSSLKVSSRPASCSARLAVASASCVLRSVRWHSIGVSPNTSGSKFVISPAICAGSALASKRVMRLIPERPATQAFQKSSFPMPLQASTPNPVITTRRSMFPSFGKNRLYPITSFLP